MFRSTLGSAPSCAHVAAVYNDEYPKVLNDSSERQRLSRSFILSGSNSVVECDLAKVEVAGSNPVSRSITAENCAENGDFESSENGDAESSKGILRALTQC